MRRAVSRLGGLDHFGSQAAAAARITVTPACPQIKDNDLAEPPSGVAAPWWEQSRSGSFWFTTQGHALRPISIFIRGSKAINRLRAFIAPPISVRRLVVSTPRLLP
jgi:hypothetical protein